MSGWSVGTLPVMHTLGDSATMGGDDNYKNCQLPLQRSLYRGFEGGSIYTSENNGKFLIIIDEGALYDLLPAEEIEGMESVEVIEFGTELERSEYLMSCFGPARRKSCD